MAENRNRQTPERSLRTGSTQEESTCNSTNSPKQNSSSQRDISTHNSFVAASENLAGKDPVFDNVLLSYELEI